MIMHIYFLRYVKTEKVPGEDPNLGEGAYGVVYKAMDTLTNREVAMKKIKVEQEDEGTGETFRNIDLNVQFTSSHTIDL